MIAPKRQLKGGVGNGGGLLIPVAETPSRTEQSDIKLVGQAVRQRWNVPDVVLDRLPTQIAQIAADGNREDRARIAAAKVLVSMIGQNNDSGQGSSVNVGVVVNHPGADLLD